MLGIFFHFPENAFVVVAELRITDGLVWRDELNDSNTLYYKTASVEIVTQAKQILIKYI